MLYSARRIKLTTVVVFVAMAVAIVSAQDPPKLQAVPDGAAAAAAPSVGGDISSPAGGSDAHAIIAGSKHVMGTSMDSTDGDNPAPNDPKDGKAKGGHRGHNGQCVTACATKSTEGVGCGNDLSKPDCFCKSENFVDQTFACINATCPQQFHGAAGVIKSICSVAGAPDLTIPGYNSSDNLENMPTVNDDDSKNKDGSTSAAVASNGSSANATAAGAAGVAAANAGGAGVTSTFTMTAAAKQTPNTGSTGSGNSSGSTGSSSSTSGAVSLAAAVTAAVSIASFGIWTLL